ncbi:unnamed protein product [Boreogadus saida]
MEERTRNSGCQLPPAEDEHLKGSISSSSSLQLDFAQNSNTMKESQGVLRNPRTSTSAMCKTEYEALVNHGSLKGIIMCRYRAKYALIFLFLALSGLMFLLRNILTLEVSVASIIFLGDITPPLP